MSHVCPTVLATNQHQFREQIERVVGFADRIQIDLSDGKFAPNKTVSLDTVWWPQTLSADLHLMYENPQTLLASLKKFKPNMVIVHAESRCDIPKFAAELREVGIKTGVALLPKTTVDQVAYTFPHIQHVLIFAGELGHFGGAADLLQLSKVAAIANYSNAIEIGWDGGINETNAQQIAAAGVHVLNVGSAIQKASSPQEAYATIKQSVAVKND